MPRTIEHIVATHEHARALRSAGKNTWPHSVDVKAILHEDQDNTTPSHISAISVRIAARLRAKIPASFFDIGHENYDFEFNDAVEAMETCTTQALAEDEEQGMEAVDMFNQWMDEIYDWADRNRVWLGN